ncbi:unnamed protein product [Phytophthora lilii]|uniref:Unnamed protein product n=1 Tax=Phytophthora lilii TaxID=2077276 RepID=A0A9W6TRA5_9STRA|nr:unnamed protein product [Phytophthora lilii]
MQLVRWFFVLTFVACLSSTTVGSTNAVHETAISQFSPSDLSAFDEKLGEGQRALRGNDNNGKNSFETEERFFTKMLAKLIILRYGTPENSIDHIYMKYYKWGKNSK